VNLTGAFFLGNAPTGNTTVFSGDNNAFVYCLPGTLAWA
jgi:hypothetical protein